MIDEQLLIPPVHIVLPLQSPDDWLDDREYIVTRVWTNGSGERWCDAHYYVDGQRREVARWGRLWELAKLTDAQLMNIQSSTAMR